VTAKCLLGCAFDVGLNHGPSFFFSYEDRGALRGTPGSAYPQPELNGTELPSSAPGRQKLVELQASASSPTLTRAEEHIATTPDCTGTAAVARSCGVVVCCHRGDVPLRAESFSAFGARRRAPSHLQSLRHNVRNRSAPSALGAVRLPLCKAFDTTWRGRS
jgi:hypothetical protein